mgnify:CR=1 FL=1
MVTSTYRARFRFFHATEKNYEPHNFDFHHNKFFIDPGHKICIEANGDLNPNYSEFGQRESLPVHLHCEILNGIIYYVKGFSDNRGIISTPLTELWPKIPMIKKHSEGIFKLMWKRKSLGFQNGETRYDSRSVISKELKEWQYWFKQFLWPKARAYHDADLNGYGFMIRNSPSSWNYMAVWLRFLICESLWTFAYLMKKKECTITMVENKYVLTVHSPEGSVADADDDDCFS